MSTLSAKEYKCFEDIKRIRPDGSEYWAARELAPVLDYAKWENFYKVIKRAMIACENSGRSTLECFPEVRKTSPMPNGGVKDILDYELSRYACYLIVQNGDPRKEVIALGQTYFAIQTYRQEVADRFNQLDEDTLEETMARLEAMPEPEAIPYQKDDVKWERFGILLSGILSTLNSHDLDSMDVEEHIPVMEQKIVSLVRRSWGIDGRSDLLDMIRYLAQEGYILRYQLYSEASSPEELMDETMDEDDRESTCRAWRFAQRYKGQYAPGFMAGWDIGRAAMLTRWGCYLGWITESEAVGILWDLSQKVVEELHSWREFAQSYLFGGLMWKLLCGDSSAGSYLGYLADAATDLLTGKAEQDNGQWRDCPWPAQRKIGFTL